MVSKLGDNPRWAIGCFALAVLSASNIYPLHSQAPPAGPLETTGQLAMDGRDVPYRIRHLPVSSFPDLPGKVAAALVSRGCLIPQTYEARRPENVIHGSLEKSGSSDWAVLCSAGGKVSLLVFFSSDSNAEPIVLKQAAETDRLQPRDATGALGFNWGIDPASPARVRDAQASMRRRPAPPDHDCIADSTVESKTIYHLYRNGAWENVETQ